MNLGKKERKYTLKTRMTPQPNYIDRPKMAPLVDGRREIEAVLRVQIRRRVCVGHGMSGNGATRREALKS